MPWFFYYFYKDITKPKPKELKQRIEYVTHCQSVNFKNYDFKEEQYWFLYQHAKQQYSKNKFNTKTKKTLYEKNDNPCLKSSCFRRYKHFIDDINNHSNYETTITNGNEYKNSIAKPYYYDSSDKTLYYSSDKTEEYENIVVPWKDNNNNASQLLKHNDNNNNNNTSQLLQDNDNNNSNIINMAQLLLQSQGNYNVGINNKREMDWDESDDNAITSLQQHDNNNNNINAITSLQQQNHDSNNINSSPHTSDISMHSYHSSQRSWFNNKYKNGKNTTTDYGDMVGNNDNDNENRTWLSVKYLIRYKDTNMILASCINNFKPSYHPSYIHYHYIIKQQKIRLTDIGTYLQRDSVGTNCDQDYYDEQEATTDYQSSGSEDQYHNYHDSTSDYEHYIVKKQKLLKKQQEMDAFIKSQQNNNNNNDNNDNVHDFCYVVCNQQQYNENKKNNVIHYDSDYDADVEEQ